MVAADPWLASIAFYCYECQQGFLQKSKGQTAGRSRKTLKRTEI